MRDHPQTTNYLEKITTSTTTPHQNELRDHPMNIGTEEIINIDSRSKYL